MTGKILFQAFSFSLEIDVIKIYAGSEIQLLQLNTNTLKEKRDFKPVFCFFLEELKSFLFSPQDTNQYTEQFTKL